MVMITKDDMIAWSITIVLMVALMVFVITNYKML
jgi:hypothetical protein